MKNKILPLVRLSSLFLAAGCLFAAPARADEGGLGFWLPGQIGTFAAVRNDPGWSWTFSGYHAYANSETRKQTKTGGCGTAP